MEVILIICENEHEKALWSELFPDEFVSRMNQCPIVYLPLGLCEPHGQISAFGLDLIKAEWLCAEAAKRIGGIVAPSLGYHIQETGYHARWLEDTVGEENPRMTSLPPHIFIQFLLYQMRSFVNAGFKAIVILTGHSGGNQEDLRQIANVFMQHIPVKVWVKSDAELVESLYSGDHAGKYEISQLLYLRPDLIDFTKKELELAPQSGGRLALGDDALEASKEYGKEIMEACLTALCLQGESLLTQVSTTLNIDKVHYNLIETIWYESLAMSQNWVTTKPRQGQREVSPNSQWKRYEFI